LNDRKVAIAIIKRVMYFCNISHTS